MSKSLKVISGAQLVLLCVDKNGSLVFIAPDNK